MKKKHTGAIVFFTLLAGLTAAAIAYFGVMFYVKTGSFIPPILSDMSGITNFTVTDIKVSDEAESSENPDGSFSDEKVTEESAKPTVTPKPTPKSKKSDKKSDKKADKKSEKKKPTPTPEPSKPEDVNDISTHEMSQYLSEMPGEDTDIVSTATSVYS